jgi:hypothetical protein
MVREFAPHIGQTRVKFKPLTLTRLGLSPSHPLPHAGEGISGTVGFFPSPAGGRGWRASAG